MAPLTLTVPRWRPAHTWVIALGFLSLVLIASGVESWSSYHKAIAQAAERAEATGKLLSGWLSASLTPFEYILQDILSDLDPAELRYPSEDLDRHAKRTELLLRKAKTNPVIQFLGLFDTQCTVTHTSIIVNLGQNFKHRDYCRMVFEEPISAFKVAPLFVSFNNKTNVTITYPVLTASQEIIGFAAMGLNLSLFQHWLDEIKPMAGSVVSIFDAKQQLLARLPMAADLIGKTIDAPILRQFSASTTADTLVFRETSLVDGIDRVWALRRVYNLPFFVVAGLPTEQALKEWWTKFIVYYLLGNLTLAAVLLFGAREYNRNHQLAQSMAEMAGTDPLTGVANRRRFIETMGLRLADACRYERPFSILLMDIDHFKPINDNFGHDVGDEVLKAFAAMLQKAARANDCIARWGGEEFIVLLPNTTQPMAAHLAERLRVLAAEMHAIPNVRITVSIGVSEYRGPEAIETLIKRADQALYQAKQQGRNQVRIAP